MLNDLTLPISASVRHVHLCRAHVDALFGPGHELTVKSELSQPGQYACQETVTLIGPKRAIPNVRVLGPVRQDTQVEISRTDEITMRSLWNAGSLAAPQWLRAAEDPRFPADLNG